MKLSAFATPKQINEMIDWHVTRWLSWYGIKTSKPQYIKMWLKRKNLEIIKEDNYIQITDDFITIDLDKIYLHKIGTPLPDIATRFLNRISFLVPINTGNIRSNVDIEAVENGFIIKNLGEMK